MKPVCPIGTDVATALVEIAPDVELYISNPHGATQGSAVRRMTEGWSARKSMWISSSPVWWGRRMAIQ